MLNLEKIFYRILLGYYYIEIKNETYKVISPPIDIKYKAAILYDKIIEDNKYDQRYLTEQEIEYYLLVNNIWNKKQDENLKDLNKSIDNTKIEIYQNFYNGKFKDRYKKELQNLYKEYNKLQTRKDCMNHLGIKDHAFSVKNEFIIMNCIYDYNNMLVFDPDAPDCDFNELQLFIKEIVNESISITDIRQLAKSDFWRSYSSCSNLEIPIINVNDDYKCLINLHKMYDNAKQHPEAPSEDIINDDDALDGWFLFQNRKADKEKKKNSMLSKLGNKAGQHNFIFADNERDAENILDINESKDKIFANEFIKYAKQEKSTEWQDLPVVRQQIQNELEMMKERKK